MLSESKLIAFIASRNLEPSRVFYEKVLGLRLMSADPRVLEFDACGTTLRISKVQALTASPYTVLGWAVRDIRSEIKALNGKGVSFERPAGLVLDDLRIWKTEDGTQVAWFKDPDGNLLSLTQY